MNEKDKLYIRTLYNFDFCHLIQEFVSQKFSKGLPLTFHQPTQEVYFDGCNANIFKNWKRKFLTLGLFHRLISMNGAPSQSWLFFLEIKCEKTPQKEFLIE